MNDEKTECQKKYNELMQKTRSYNIDETAANDYRTVFIILLVIASVILITIDMLSDYDFSKDEVILTAIILLLYGIKIFLRFKKIHKTRCFEIIANELHKTIISD